MNTDKNKMQNAGRVLEVRQHHLCLSVFSRGLKLKSAVARSKTRAVRRIDVIERGRVKFDTRRLIRFVPHFNHIEATGDIVQLVKRNVSVRQTRDLFLLGKRDGFLRRAALPYTRRIGAPRFHFDKAQDIIMPRDDVDFAAHRAIGSCDTFRALLRVLDVW